MLPRVCLITAAALVLTRADGVWGAATVCDDRCEELNDGDTAFMIMASTFVMLQTPALGLAQAGIIRRKNALSMLMQTLTGFSIGSLLWFLVGFSLTFGPTVGGAGVIGGLQHALLLGVEIDCCYPLSSALTIPGVLFATFQLMFATVRKEKDPAVLLSPDPMHYFFLGDICSRNV